MQGSERGWRGMAPVRPARMDAWWAVAPAAFAALILYWMTLAPSITLAYGTGDSGELASTAYTLGIAHPTGYPLYTLVGYLVSHVGAEPAHSLNLLSAVMGACAVGLLAWLAVRCAWDAAPRASAALALVAGACAVVPFALSTDFWTEAVATETRTVAIALDGVVLALLIVPARLSARAAMGAAVVYGLALCDHLLSLYLAPACVLLCIPWARTAWTRWLALAGGVALGLLPYLYLPMRAAQHPAANWGDPSTPGRFLWVVSGKEYRYEMFQYAFPAFLRRLESYVGRLQHELTGITLVAALIGAIALGRRRPLVAIALALTIVIDVVGTSNYQADAAPAYLLLAAYCLCILAAAGWLAVAFLVASVARRFLPAAGAVVLVSLLCLAFEGAAEQPAASNAHQAVATLGATDVRAYAVSTLHDLPPHAILLAGDVMFEGQILETPMPLWYAQRALHVRPDVTLVAVGMLPFAWYYQQLRAVPAFDARLLPPSSASSDAGVDYALTSQRMRLLVRAARAGHPLFSVAPEFMLGALCPVQVPTGRLVRLHCAGVADR